MLDHDLIIVGAGIAGITLAKHLSKELSIGIIEKGDYKYSIINNSHDYGTCSEFGNFPINNYSVNYTSMKAVGGNSHIWSGWCSPMFTEELKTWPINIKEIETYYKKNRKIL